MNRHLALLAALLLLQPLAAEVVRDIVYAEHPGHDPVLTSLDVYAPEAAAGAPVLVYVHGGGWYQGDKGRVAFKPGWFNARGYVFVSVNYRLAPEVVFPTPVQDVAAAVAWVRAHIADHGGDHDRIAIVGHSAGAHLVGMLATDPRYLREQGLEPGVLHAAVINDSAAYDLVARAERGGGSLVPPYSFCFGQDPAVWAAASPKLQVRPERDQPPLLVIYSGGSQEGVVNPLRGLLAEDFVAHCGARMHLAQAYDASDRTHEEVNTQMGAPGDDLAPAVHAFIGAQSRLARLRWQRDLAMGSVDEAGELISATEVMELTAHAGKLFAVTSCWNHDTAQRPYPGTLILVKDAADAAWRVEHRIADSLRGGVLRRFTLRTDHTGAPLDEPRTVLVTAPSRAAGTSLLVRDDATASWHESVIDAEAPAQGYVRSLATHTDAVTGIDHVFVGTGASALFRGAYDASAPGSLRWHAEPELTGSERMHACCAADGRLWVSVGSDGDPSNRDGGLYVRRDGPDENFAPGDARWRLVWEWPLVTGKPPGLRGLTAIERPGATQVEILAALEAEGIVYRIGTQDESVAVDYDYHAAFLQAWDGFGGAAALAAYNDMPVAVDPRGEAPVRLIGLFINHPDNDAPPYNGSWYLVRNRAGGYARGAIVDHAAPPPPGSSLRGCRSIVPSPFAGDPAGTLYAAGFDAAGGPWLDTGWIHRGAPTPSAWSGTRRITIAVRQDGEIVPTSAICTPSGALSPRSDGEPGHVFRGLQAPVDHVIEVAAPAAGFDEPPPEGYASGRRVLRGARALVRSRGRGPWLTSHVQAARRRGGR